MKIAYLIAVHKNSQLLERAIATLSSENCGFFIHVDQKSNVQQFAEITAGNVHMLESRMPVYWGEFSQVEVTLRLLRAGLADPAEYDYFTFLQGSDYPLRSGRYIEAFLQKNQGSEFINLTRMPAPGYPLSKIDTRRYPSEKPIRRFVMRVLAKMGMAKRDHRKYLRGLEPYAGQAYWVLSREACRYITEYTLCNRNFEDYFRTAFTSDEMFFHTILGNSPFCSRVRKSLMFVDPDWSIPGETRHLVTADHVRFFESQGETRVEDEWGSGEVLFARKFSDDTLELVDRIDAMIARKDGAFSVASESIGNMGQTGSNS